ncbi:MAG: motility protein A [Planctomycetota bacterium]
MAAVFLVYWGMYSASDGNMMLFTDAPSIAIVIGGGVSSVLVSSPLGDMLKLFKVVAKTLFNKPVDPQKLIKDLVSFAELARRDGILALENVINNHEFEFLKKGVRLAVDGTEPELIDTILNSEVENISKRHASGKKICDLMGKYGPAYGMLGTLIGLIAMLANLSDVSTLGPKMGVALITTFYGAIVSNMIFLPIADKLEMRSKQEMLILEMVIKGVMSIQQGDNPRIVQQKLSIYLPPNARPEEE